MLKFELLNNLEKTNQNEKQRIYTEFCKVELDKVKELISNKTEIGTIRDTMSSIKPFYQGISLKYSLLFEMQNIWEKIGELETEVVQKYSDFKTASYFGFVLYQTDPTMAKNLGIIETAKRLSKKLEILEKQLDSI